MALHYPLLRLFLQSPSGTFFEAKGLGSFLVGTITLDAIFSYRPANFLQCHRDHAATCLGADVARSARASRVFRDRPAEGCG
jgi:hypothetical protein